MQKSELELIIETIPDAVAVIDDNGNIIFANRAAEIILGLSRSEIKGRTYNAPDWKITTPEGKPFPEEELPFAQVMRLKKPIYGIEHAIERPDGKGVILSINAAPMMDEKDNVERVVISLTDITERKMIELALKESEQRFRELLKEIDFAAVIIDVNGRIEFANDYILDLVELNRDLVIGRDFFNTFAAEDQKEAAKARFFDALAGGTAPKHNELQIVTFEGERRTISFSNVTIRDTNGSVAGVAGIGIDVTEQRRAAQEIRESRKQVLDILESITDGFYALDNDWRFTYVNRRAEELFGIKREQLLFRNIWQVVNKEQAPEMYEKYHQAKEHMNPVIFEEFAPRLKKWLEMHVYPYQNGLSVYIRDVTDRKHADEERLANLRFFESMDRVNRAISGTNDLERMTSDTLNEVLSIFDADRSYFLYPLDPEASSWHIPMERARPGYESPLTARTSVPMESSDVTRFKLLLEAKSPLRFGPGGDYPLTDEFRQHFGIGSIMSMAIFPRIGKPWMFGVAQSAYPRVWTDEEARLLNEIGRRIADGLTSLLIYHELRESEQELQRSNDLLKTIIDAAPVAIMGLDLDGNVMLVWNPAAEKMLGWSKEEAMGHHLPSVVSENEEEFAKFRERIHQGLTLSGVEVHRKSRNGSPIDYSIYAAPFRDNDGSVIGNIAILVDITERKKAETELYRTNRELRAIRSCNQVMLRTDNEQTLLNEVCRIIYDEAGYRFVWVGYVEHDEAKSVRPVAWAGFEDKYLEAASITWADTERGQGPTGNAIRSGTISYIQDFATDPKAAPWKDLALKRGYRSSIALPLRDESKNVFGILNIYSSEANAFSTDEIHLMEELAGDLEFGIIALRNRVERKKDEEKIRHQLNELQRWYDVTLNREERVYELKREVNQLLAQLNRPVRYPSQP
jgi:PAS domain S-box-containing protein